MEELEIILETENNQEQEISLISENNSYAGGTSNYLDLENKPKINGIELIEDKTTEDLGIINDVNNYIQEHKEELKGDNYVLTETDKEDISKLVEVNIPKKVSELENDKGYLNSIPLEYVTENELKEKQFATESYVKNEIAKAELSGEDVDLSGYATKDELKAKVDKVNGKSLIDDTEIERLKTVTNYDDTGIKVLINNKADKNVIPTKMSELDNDKGYLTSIPSEYKTKTENDNLYQEKGNYLTSFTESDPTVPNYIKNIKESDINNWNNKSEFSGNYNDLTNQPTNISAFTNDKGYLTSVPSTYKTKTENDSLYQPKGSYLTSVPSEYKTKTENDNLYQPKGNYLTSVPSEYATKNDVIGAISSKADKTSIPTKTSQLINDNGYITGITEAMKDELVQAVVEALGGVSIFGYVDENKNIIISGEIADGEYVVKYEMEEGEPITIGNLVLDTTVEYHIEYLLTNCTISDERETIGEGEKYNATVSPIGDEYEIKSITVTMGVDNVPVSPIDDGYEIVIDEVKGAIRIIAVAEKIEVTDNYTITYNIPNCTSTNNITTITAGSPYSATISANQGFVINSLTATMDGDPITVTNGEINILSVSGPIVITASTAKNWIPNSINADGTPFENGVGYKANTRLSLSGGGETPNATDYECTGFIEVNYDSIIRIKDVKLDSENATNIVIYDKDFVKIPVASANYGTTLHSFFVQYGTKTNDVYSNSIKNFRTKPVWTTDVSKVKYIRIGSKEITSKSVITVDEELL